MLCGVIHAISGGFKPLLGYFGLPLLWKGPVDFEDPQAKAAFWKLFYDLAGHSRSTLVTNNPMLAEQIWVQTGIRIDAVRPHAFFTELPAETRGRVYLPRSGDVLVVARTRFLWVTFDCALQQLRDPGYPLKFVVSNSNTSFSFDYMSSVHSVVLLPWEHALMAFYEFYSMNVPILLPTLEWTRRLIFLPGSNLASTSQTLYQTFAPGCPTECAQAPSGIRNVSQHPSLPSAFTKFLPLPLLSIY